MPESWDTTELQDLTRGLGAGPIGEGRIPSLGAEVPTKTAQAGPKSGASKESIAAMEAA